MFQLKPEVSASEALDAFFAGPSVAECAIVILALQYAEVRDQIGVEKFDELFGSTSQKTQLAARMCLSTLGVGWGNPLGFFVDAPEGSGRSVGGKNQRPGVLGEQVYFTGVPGYFRKHPDGAAQGWNVIYCGRNDAGDQVYRGFGLGGLKTEEEIRTRLVDGFNKDRTPEDSAYIEIASDRTNFDLELHNVPDKVPDAEDSWIGFEPGGRKFFRGESVLMAIHAPIETTLVHIATAAAKSALAVQADLAAGGTGGAKINW